jgi:prolyl-tRNA synthetase
MIGDIEKPDGTVAETFVFSVLRGDMELNETKLTNAIKARRLRPAVTEEILAIGAEPGYGSPLGIRRDRVLLVVDDLVASSPNLVAGANKPGYHLRNTNYGRDYSADIVTDLVAVSAGYACPTCTSPVHTARGVEVGNIFKLGTKYSIAMGATYLDENGESQPIVMGSYGIGSERLMAVVIELHHDDNGIQWPITIAPYQVMLVSLATEKTPEVSDAAERIYADLQAAGIEVLYDDRDERAGVKFNDADLLGIPIRLTVGGKGLKNGIVEMKLRRNGETGELPLATIVQEVQALVAAEIARIQSKVVPMPLKD